MAAFTKDTGLYKKCLIGVLAAGSGVAVYYSYKKWKNRPWQDLQPDDEPAKVGQKQENEEKEKDTTETKVSDPPKPEATPLTGPVSPRDNEKPLQTSTPSVSRSTSNDPNQDLLSLSGSFEKVSLSALRESNDDNSVSSGDKSPSESFEKVSLPSSSSNSADSTPPTKEEKPASPSSSGPRVQFDEKVIKHDTSTPVKSPVPPATLPKPKIGTKAEMKMELPGATKPQSPPSTGPTSPTSAPSRIPQPVKQASPEVKVAAPKPVEATKVPEAKLVDIEDKKEKEEKKESESESEEEEEGDGGSDSDASGDSQVEATRGKQSSKAKLKKAGQDTVITAGKVPTQNLKTKSSTELLPSVPQDITAGFVAVEPTLSNLEEVRDMKSGKDDDLEKSISSGFISIGSDVSVEEVEQEASSKVSKSQLPLSSTSLDVDKSGNTPSNRDPKGESSIKVGSVSTENLDNEEKLTKAEAETVSSVIVEKRESQGTMQPFSASTSKSDNSLKTGEKNQSNEAILDDKLSKSVSSIIPDKSKSDNSIEHIGADNNVEGHIASNESIQSSNQSIKSKSDVSLHSTKSKEGPGNDEQPKTSYLQPALSGSSLKEQPPDTSLKDISAENVEPTEQLESDNKNSNNSSSPNNKNNNAQLETTEPANSRTRDEFSVVQEKIVKPVPAVRDHSNRTGDTSSRVSWSQGPTVKAKQAAPIPAERPGKGKMPDQSHEPRKQDDGKAKSVADVQQQQAKHSSTESTEKKGEAMKYDSGRRVEQKPALANAQMTTYQPSKASDKKVATAKAEKAHKADQKQKTKFRFFSRKPSTTADKKVTTKQTASTSVQGIRADQKHVPTKLSLSTQLPSKAADKDSQLSPLSPGTEAGWEKVGMEGEQSKGAAKQDGRTEQTVNKAENTKATFPTIQTSKPDDKSRLSKEDGGPNKDVHKAEEKTEPKKLSLSTKQPTKSEEQEFTPMSPATEAGFEKVESLVKNSRPTAPKLSHSTPTVMKSPATKRHANTKQSVSEEQVKTAQFFMEDSHDKDMQEALNTEVEDKFDMNFVPPQSPRMIRRTASMASTSSSSSVKDMDNIMYTFRRLENCSSQLAPMPERSNIKVRNPQNGKPLDLGLSLDQPSDTRALHRIRNIEDSDLAKDGLVQKGDELIAVNNNLVSDWKQDIVLEYLRQSDPSKLNLIVKSTKTGANEYIRLLLTTEGKETRLTSEVIPASSLRLSPVIPLGEFTPKVCNMTLAGKEEYVMRSHGGTVTTGQRMRDDRPLEMMRLLFVRSGDSAVHVPVTMLAFSTGDVLHYLCAPDERSVTTVSQKDLSYHIEDLPVADYRFFHHRFIGGNECFESVLYPDHYLYCSDGRLSLRHLQGATNQSLEQGIQFHLRYLFVPTEEHLDA